MISYTVQETPGATYAGSLHTCGTAELPLILIADAIQNVNHSSIVGPQVSKLYRVVTKAVVHPIK